MVSTMVAFGVQKITVPDHQYGLGIKSQCQLCSESVLWHVTPLVCR